MKSQVNPRFVVIAQKEAKAKQEASSKQESSNQQAQPAGQVGAAAQSGGEYQAPQNYQPPANQGWQPAAPAPAPQPQTGGGSSGYQLQPGEVWIDKNNMDQDGSITLGGDEDGNVW